MTIQLDRRTALLSSAATVAALAVSTVGGSRTQAWAADIPSGACSGPVTPASLLPVRDCDSDARIVEKAANVVPTASQLAWQRREVTAFTHFGMDTFTDREWGSGAEDPKTFDPKRVDVEQWMDAIQAAGARLAMLTAKHHDGFTLYPSRYSAHTVRSSPWWKRGGGASGGGDILRSYVDAARRRKLRVGVYLSPADGAELPHAWHARWVEKIRKKKDDGEQLSIEEQATLDDGDRDPGGRGRYGNGSARRERTIPTLVDGDDRAADVRSGKLPSFTFTLDDYNAFYLNQLYELFTEYGPIDELWLDGANPWKDAGISEEYDFASWYRMVEKLSPNTVVFGGPRGVRWVGNEDGRARETEWSVTPHTGDPAAHDGASTLPDGDTAKDLGSRKKLTAPGIHYLQWYPAEADVSLRKGWFHHPEEQPKSASDLVELYHTSVGRNAVLLLNIPPAKDGRVPAGDIEELTEFRRVIRTTYGQAVGGGTRDEPWSPSGTTGSLTVRADDGRKFDRVRIGEDVTRGQRVEKFRVQVPDGSGWKTVAQGSTIGCGRILSLDSPVRADRVRLTVDKARATPAISRFSLHCAVTPK